MYTNDQLSRLFGLIACLGDGSHPAAATVVAMKKEVIDLSQRSQVLQLVVHEHRYGRTLYPVLAPMEVEIKKEWVLTNLLTNFDEDREYLVAEVLGIPRTYDGGARAGRGFGTPHASADCRHQSTEIRSS